MLYLIYQANHVDLTYRGGQNRIVHIEADFHASIKWAEGNQKRWAFTSSNAGSFFFEDYCDQNDLSNIDWEAVQAIQWQSCKDLKQAEFLLEERFPWHLIERIGVCSYETYHQANTTLRAAVHKPQLEIMSDWYY